MKTRGIDPRLLARALVIMAVVTAAIAIGLAWRAASPTAPHTAALAAAGYAVGAAWYIAAIAIVRRRADWAGPALVLLVAAIGPLLSALTPDIAPVAALAALAFGTLCLPYFSARTLVAWGMVAAVVAGACVALGQLRPFGTASLGVPLGLVFSATMGVGFVLFVVMLHYRTVLSASITALEDSKAGLEAAVEARTHALEVAMGEAQAASRAKEEFIAAMSHEIRTPMNAVIGMTSLLANTPMTAEQAEFTTTIRTSGEHLLVLINDVLDFAKIDAGKLELETIAFAVHQIAHESIDLVAASAKAKGVAIACTIADDVPARVVSDPVRLRQILANLAGNAVKFTERGRIDIAVTAPAPGRLAFAITDTGIGIPADKLSKLFQPFTQVDASTTRRYGGSGLGLYIAQKLARALGGDLAVTSTVGTGSTFVVEIAAPEPLARAGGDATTTEPTPVPERTLSAPIDVGLAGRHPLTVLVAEDNAVNQRVVVAMLARLGYTADVVANGAEAVASLARQHYDLVLMDVQMPVMDGLAAAREIRAAGDRRVWIVALTANAGADDRAACIAAGMSDYVTKPVTIAALAKALEGAPPTASR